jgi:hypothetical protein
MNKTLTALVMAGAVALGACSDNKPSPRADVLTVVREKRQDKHDYGDEVL